MKRIKPKYLLLVLTVLTLVAQTVEAGRLRRLIYPNYSGAVISALYTNNMFDLQTFPDSPEAVEYIPPEPGGPMSVPTPYLMESVINGSDNYGSLLRGYVTAPETGQYVFYLSSDDECQFYLNTDSADSLNPAKTNLICHVPGWSNTREWNKYPTQQSAPITLQKGVTYFLQILHKEGTGGDHIVLGWQTPSGTLEQPMPPWHFQAERDTRWSETDVEAVLGPVVPLAAGDLSIMDGMRVVTYANVNLDQPVTYQWLKNGAAVPGATDAYYIFRATMADNGTLWSVRATSGGNSYTSAENTLSVLGDGQGPTIASAGTAYQNPTVVQIVFSEEVKPQGATNLANYTLPGATLESATLQPDFRTVLIKTSLLTPDTAWVLTVKDIQDWANNMIAPNPTTMTLLPADGRITYRGWYAPPNDPAGTSLAALRTWSSTATPGATYANDQFSEELLITTNSFGWNIVPLRNNYAGQLIGFLTAPETGDYQFAIASDDHGTLYLGTNHLRSSKREIAYSDGSTGRWNTGQRAAQRSANIRLEAGKRYYIEAVWRDGTGGDGVTLFWKIPSNPNPIPTANESVQANTEPFVIPTIYESPYGTFGPITLKTDLPATLATAESSRPTLRVVAEGNAPHYFVWLKNGAVIPGANAASYTLPYVTLADNNATYQVVVSNNFSSATSAQLTLSVNADATKPTVASVGSLLKQVVEARFSEPVTAASAGNVQNYTLLNSTDGQVAVSGVTVDPADPTHVTLQTAAMPETDLMRLVVQNVVDASGAANVMEASTNVFRAHNFDAVERINNGQAWGATASGDSLTMTAGGSDIWGTADQMTFAYKTVTGNFDYRVYAPTALPTVNQWVKMGPMARVNRDANSRNVFAAWTPPTPAQNTYTAQVRQETGVSTSSSNDAGTPLNAAVQGGVAARPTVVYPSWLRLQRIDDTFYMYYSTDAAGANWTLWTYYDSVNSAEGLFPKTMLLGLALTSHDTARTADGIMTSFSSIDDGALRITLQPGNTNVVEGGTAYFYAGVAGHSPYLYQWLKNSNPIQDATNLNLVLPRVTYNDNNAQFVLRVTNPQGESVSSTPATLTVQRDGTAPTVRYYVMPKINLNPTEVKLVFSEPMDPNTAQNAANYAITAQPGNTPLAISSVLMDVDERTVILYTANQVAGTLYKVVVNNVLDLACCPPNAVAANSTDYFYYAGSSGKFAQRADGFIIMEAENAQRNTPATGAAWEMQTDATYAPWSGVGYMLVPTTGGAGGSANGTTGIANGSALEYDIVFTRPATNYTIWLRGRAHNNQPTGNNDSVYLAMDGTIVAIGPSSNVEYSQMSGWVYSWDWRSDRNAGSDPLALTNVPPGTHTFTIHLREDATIIDKIVIEPGIRSNAGNSTEPAVASANGGLGEPENWDWQVAPPAAPTVTIGNPVNGQRFANNANIAIEATITGTTPASSVEFYNGATLLGTVNAAPFTYNWASVPEGVYTLTARVTDVLGYQVTSPAVQVVVDSTKPVPYAVGSLQGTGIGVYFMDTTALDAATAGNPANYTVNGGAVTVTNATIEPDGRAVMLALSAPISGDFSVAIKDVADTGFGPNVVDPTTLNSSVVNWAFNQDIGTVNATNSAAFTDPIRPGYAQAIGTDGFYVRASGSDIWNTADGMHFVYQEMTGDFDVSVRVQSLDRPNEWAKASIMVREDLDGNSRNMMALVAPPPIGSPAGMNLFNAQIRDSKGGATVSLATANRPTPVPYPDAWLRLTRADQTFTFSWKTNETAAWATLLTTNMPASAVYADKVYVGLATTSHSNVDAVGNMATAYYREVTGFGAVAPSTPALAVSATATELTITWTSSDSSYKLESTANLGTGPWADVTGTPTVNGDNYSLTVPIGTTSQFYRLRK